LNAAGVPSNAACADANTSHPAASHGTCGRIVRNAPVHSHDLVRIQIQLLAQHHRPHDRASSQADD
jgi:hypothetical protein